MQPSIVIRLAGAGDETLFERIAPDVFDDAVQPALVAEFLGDPRHHIALALDGDTIIGMASGVHYVHPDKPPQLWINELGVAPDYRGQGVARRLLRAVFDAGRKAGCTEAWVGTDVDNTVARRVYAAVGGSEETMVCITFDLAADATR